MHVERPRGDAAVRRRHRASGRVLPHRHDQPRRGPGVLSRPRRRRSQPGGPRGVDRGRHRERRPEGPCRVRDDVRGRAAIRRVARPRPRRPARPRVRLRSLGRKGLPRRPRRRDPVADEAATRGEGYLPLSHGSGARRGPGRRQGSNGRCLRAPARPHRAAEPRRASRRAGRDADVGAGDRSRAVPEDLDRRRAGRRRVPGDRRAHRPQDTVAARAFDRGRRARRGGSMAPGPLGGRRHAPATGGVGPRSRPDRRVERDLGEAGTARIRRVGARAAPPALHRAGLRPVALARPCRHAGRFPPRAAGRLRLPPRYTRSCARSGGPDPRGGRLLRSHARGASAPAGPRRGGGGDGAAPGGRRRTARHGGRRRDPRRRRPPARDSGRAVCLPG